MMRHGCGRKLACKVGGEPGTTNDRGIENGALGPACPSGLRKKQAAKARCAESNARGRSMHVCLDEAMADENETVAPRYH